MVVEQPRELKAKFDTPFSGTKADLLLTIDVEDWFHLVGAGLDYQFKDNAAAHADWQTFPSRLEITVPWILDQLDRHHRKGTFFVLGWAADRHPELIREIDRRGHEVASHSYWHRIVYRQSREEFRADLVRSKKTLEDIIGKPLAGFRASTASISEWAVEILAEEGFRYDASLFPASYHDVYGRLSGMDGDDFISRHRSGIFEIKFSCLDLFGIKVPWSGGGYFRLLPFRFFEGGIRRTLRRGQPFMFFTHPWELDPDTPRLLCLKKRYALRRYVGVETTRDKFTNLLRKYNTTRIDSYLSAQGLA